MNQFVFGAGQLWGMPTIALDGTAISNPTPVPFAGVQEVTLDVDFTIKEAFGSKQFPLAVGRGTSKLTGKAKVISVNAAMWNDLVLGESTTQGITKVENEEAGIIPDTPGPYVIAAALALTFVLDLGVKDALTKAPYTRVSSITTPTTGQYSVTAGVYTFAAADKLKAVLISYTYYDDTAGVTFKINNNLIGSAVYFKAVFSETFQGKTLTVTLNRCMGKKLSFLGTKLEDFQVSDFDFSAMADDNEEIGEVSMTAVA